MEGNPSATAVAGASDPPPAKRRKFDYDLTKTFDVLVGKEPNQQRFTVYHDILTRRSEFFRAARSGRWTIQPNQATVLDDHEPDVFSVYLHCVTFGRKALEEHIGAIPVTERIDSEDTDGDYSERAEKEKESTQGNPKADEIEDTQTTALESDGREESDDIDHYVWKIGDNGFRSKFLVDLYLLADKLIDPVTANMAIDKLIRVSEARNEYPGPRLISYVYESTTTESPLRRLCRDWYLFAVDESWVDTLHHDSYPHAFMKDLVYETYDLQRNNQRKRVHKVFAAEKLAVRRTNKYYHQFSFFPCIPLSRGSSRVDFMSNHVNSANCAYLVSIPSVVLKTLRSVFISISISRATLALSGVEKSRLPKADTSSFGE